MNRRIFSLAGFVFSVLVLVAVQAGRAQAQPAVTLSSNSLSFGLKTVGTTSVAQIVTLTNTGNADLTITSIHAVGSSASFVAFSSCGDTVPPAGSCTFGVNFAPETAGMLQGSITVADNAADSPQKVKCTGTGVAVAALLSASSLNFGTVGVGSSSTSQTVTLTNQSSSRLTFGPVSTTGDFNVTGNSCQGALAAGAACTISVNFTPASPGTLGGRLSISDSDRTSPQLVSLLGTGTGGTIVLSPASLTFSSQAIGTTSAAKSITITNSGSTAAGMVAVDASGDFGQTNNCGASLAAGASCTVSVTFTPSAKGSRNGFVTIQDTDPTNVQSANLSGSGSSNGSASVAISPKLTSLTLTQPQTYSAKVNGVLDTDVTWSVDGIAGGNSTVGIISAAGVYTPPATAGSHLITATTNSQPVKSGTVPVVVTDFAGTFTYHNDNGRTGQNLNERLLTAGNVNSGQFGKLAALKVDAKVYAQPLYVSSVSIPGKGIHNVVYVATENDSAYAFDADSGSTTPLWTVNFTDPDNGVTAVPSADVEHTCSSITPNIGISGTPVIDPVSKTIFMIARTKEVQGGLTTYHHKLHALDITTGRERAGSPVDIQASVPGQGSGSDNKGNVLLDNRLENSRVSLLLAGGVVYGAWSSLCDEAPYHGWVIGWDASTLAQVSAYNTTPNGSAGGIWQAQAGLAADAQSNIYLLTSNGLFDVPNGGTSYGESVVKLASDGVTVADYFTPYNTTALTLIDYDLSSVGPLLLPDQPVGPPHVMIASGKEGTIYLLDRDNMGQFNAVSDGGILEELYRAVGFPDEEFEPYFGKPAVFNNHAYFWGVNDVLKDFRLYQGLLSPVPVISGTYTATYPGPIPTISANGAANGIVWVVQDNPPLSNTTVLRAYDATNVARELYNSANAQRDKAGKPTRYQVPTVANGKVYVGTQTEVDVYGLLP